MCESDLACLLSGREGQLQAAAAFAAVPEPSERVDAPTAADAQPYVTDGVVFTSYPATSTRTSRTNFSIRREEGMRVDAMMGEADGEDEKTLMIQSLRAMVDGLKRQVHTPTSCLNYSLVLFAPSAAVPCARCDDYSRSSSGWR